jgi:hypothetical protein
MSNRLSTAQRRAAAPVQRGTELTRTAPTGRRWQHQSAWSDVRVRAALAIGVPALSGLAAGLVMPRGPVVAAHALLLLVSGVAVGTAAGYALRSRWAMMLAPAAHLLVFELVRLGADGPTVDGVHFGVVGIMAFVVGRGFYALVTLFPMTVGAVYGARLARGNRWPHPLTAIAGIAVIALAGLIMRPAGTPAILGADGQPLPGSVATLEKVNLGGHEQWISIRGHSVDNPVLLFLLAGRAAATLAGTGPSSESWSATWSSCSGTSAGPASPTRRWSPSTR